jgi:hypothetical protein
LPSLEETALPSGLPMVIDSPLKLTVWLVNRYHQLVFAM